MKKLSSSAINTIKRIMISIMAMMTERNTKYKKIVLIIIIALGLPRSTKSTVSKNSFLIFTAIIPNIFP